MMDKKSGHTTPLSQSGLGAAKRLALIFLALFSFGGAGSCAQGRVQLDASITAVEANDDTALIGADGCGRQVADGILDCREVAGADATHTNVYFIGPPAACAGTGACVHFKIYFPDGTGPYGGEIPRGQTRQAVAWSTILGASSFQIGHRGLWGIEEEVDFLDPNGNPRSLTITGNIYLEVLRADYVSLHDVAADPSFAWSWLENGVPVKMSTAGRVYVGGGSDSPFPVPSGLPGGGRL